MAGKFSRYFVLFMLNQAQILNCVPDFDEEHSVMQKRDLILKIRDGLLKAEVAVRPTILYGYSN
uniref:Uncharacterized protein n=1 Tax=Oryza sativa subsp. japonica TaxID=39947 RepID=Q2RBC1_ORYSJ|nr:hypothetical protein LOC_Os11g02500 [Oryza sativa Japonica Group]